MFPWASNSTHARANGLGRRLVSSQSEKALCRKWVTLIMTGSELNSPRVSTRGLSAYLCVLCVKRTIQRRERRDTQRTSEFIVLVFVLTTFCLDQGATAQSNYSLRSPDQRIEVRVRAADRLSYDVLLNGTLLLQNSTLSMNINRANLGAQPRVRTTKQRSENKEIISPVPQKSARIREHYNELRLEWRATMLSSSEPSTKV